MCKFSLTFGEFCHKQVSGSYISYFFYPGTFLQQMMGRLQEIGSSLHPSLNGDELIRLSFFVIPSQAGERQLHRLFFLLRTFLLQTRFWASRKSLRYHQTFQQSFFFFYPRNSRPSRSISASRLPDKSSFPLFFRQPGRPP